MDPNQALIHWAPKVPQAHIRRLYNTDARGIVDDELIERVAWALWARCDSILDVTAAHHGQVRCPSCAANIPRAQRGTADEVVRCGACGWQLAWAAYHRTYRGKQLFGANAVAVFAAYHQALPHAPTAPAKMLLIDQLIHAFHVGLTEPGRPAGANLIEGSLGAVITFLDRLTSAGTSATGLGDSRTAWRRRLETAAWSQAFVDRETTAEPARDT
jgi:ribosomal protein L37AE/L43A